MTFKKRDRVVCIDDTGFVLATRREKLPIAGTIYQIRDVIGACIRLVEFVNEPRQYDDGYGELAFKASRFLKVRGRNMPTFTVRSIMAIPGTTTLNPADKSALLSLSGGNLTGSNSNESYQAARSITSYSSSKKYCEMTAGNAATTGFRFGLGIADGSFTLASNMSQSADAVVFYNGDPSVYKNSVSVGTVTNYTNNGAIVGMAVDLGGKLLWYRVDGGIWNNNAANNPATGVGGIDISSITQPWFACLSLHPQGAGQSDATMNFGATSYAGTPPSGFDNW